MKRIASFFLAVTALVAIAVAQGALSINGAGATFPYPMYSKWFDEYHKKNSDLQINYQSIGSGGGIKQVTEGTVEVVLRSTREVRDVRITAIVESFEELLRRPR